MSTTTELDIVAQRMRTAEHELHQTQRALGTTQTTLYHAQQRVEAWETIRRYLEATRTGLSAGTDGRLTITDQGGTVLYRDAGPLYLARLLDPVLRQMANDDAQARIAAMRRGTADSITGARTL